jgi:uracil-DNA glycosylase family 4
MPSHDAGHAPTTLASLRETIVSCDRCPRLRTYGMSVAREKKAAHRDDSYWGRPVPGFGDPDARVVVVGLAPAAHGANRTGRVFTGDGSGDFLMRAMHATGFASIPTARHADDGLVLYGAYITAAVRCAPPANRPLPSEIRNCQPHLEAELDLLRAARVIVALGGIAYDTCRRLVRTRGLTTAGRPPFGHDVVWTPAGFPIVIASYHPSRQNTNTGRLTAPMLRRVFARARRLAG